MSSTSGEFEVKAVVSESNGEVSCSVEETNRIRKLLGLNPLRIDAKSSESVAVENFRNKKAAEDKAKEELDIRQKLEQAKNRRLLNAKVQGKSLADIDSGSKAGAEASDESALGSASDWVQRSRAKAQAAAAQAAIDAEKAKITRTAADEREKYESSHLKGLKIKHSAEAFGSLHRTSNLDSLSEGIILTLAEKAILRKDGRGRVIEANDDDDDDDDVLVNVNLEEDEKRQERERRAKRMKQPVYGGYDDDEFEELNEDGQAPPTKKKLLSHYDLERDEAARKSGNVLVIGDKGSLEGTKSKNRSAVGAAGDLGNQWADFDDNDDEGEEAKKAAATAQQSLQIQRQAIADYYTTSEYAAANPSASFSKGKKKTKRVKKVRSKRVAEDEDDDGEVEGGGLDQLQVEDTDKDVIDRGSRRANGGAAGSGSSRNTGATTFGSASSGHNYAAAVANARAKNVKTFAPSNGASAPGAGASSTSATQVINDEDLEAARQMARARKIAQQQQFALEQKVVAVESLNGNRDNDDGDVGAQKVRELLQMQLAAGLGNGATTESKSVADGGSMTMDEGGEDAGGDEDEVDAEGRRRRDGRLVFNDTTEFTSLLRARLNEKARLRAEDAVRDQERSEKVQPSRAQRVPVEGVTSGVASTGAGTEVGSKRNRDEAGMAAEEDGEEVMDEAAEWERLREQAEEEDKAEGDSGDEKNGDDDQLGFLHRQPLASSGLASALALLKQSDSLKPKEELYGRARDARDFPTGPTQSTSAATPSSSSGDRQFNVNIEYRDKQGHLLTKKDAFRQMCYDFHGIGPSRKKEEKRMREVEKMHKAKTSDLSVAGTMRSLTQTQAATGKAFVTIQGGLGTTSSAAADLAQAAAKGAKEKARAARLQ